MNRNFIRGLMDGSLTTLGVIVATLNNPEVLLTAGLGVATANALSNACGGYVSEKTEKINRHAKFEKAMLIKRGLARTIHMTRAEIDSLKLGLLDSAGTFLGALVPLSFVLLIQGSFGLYLGIIVPVFMYIALGVWMGLLSRENIIISAMKTSFFAVATIAIAFLIKIYA